MIKPEQIPSGAESDVTIAAPNLRYRQDLSRLIPVAGDEPTLLIRAFNLAVGSLMTVNTDTGVPDYWSVSLIPAAGVKLAIYVGPQASGDPIWLTGGGYAKIPGLSEFITVVSNTGTCQGNVIAVRKYSGVEVLPGNLA